jgi:Domain of unknown function (DUF4347)/Glucose / Sorbosone dehydrogenase/PA14 domain/Calx-beta domain
MQTLNSPLPNSQLGVGTPGQPGLTPIGQSGLVFIDPSLSSYKNLAASALQGEEVILLDPTLDGVAQITAALADRANVSSLHILSHGFQGSLQLASSQLSLDTLAGYSSQLQQWGQSLTADADILLYGCSLAGNADGLSLVRQIGQLTGADVAASTNLTGSAALGGDWNFEVQTGGIEAGLAFNNSALQAYQATLGLTGEYFDNKDFTGSKFTRVDPTVNFNWGLGSPDPRIGVDTFSVRWTGQVQSLYTGLYTFYSTTDDGVRVLINGQPVINRFVDQPATEARGTFQMVAGTKYDITMEYYENGGAASAQLAWSSAQQVKQIIPDSQLSVIGNPDTPPPGTGTGLTGEYFDNQDFTNSKLSRVDATVNFDWGRGSPAPSIGPDTFSVRWSGQVQPLYTGNYTFYTTTDDGVLLFINGQPVIRQFIDQPATEASGTFQMVAGTKYDIKMEYYENGGGASPLQAKQIIPTSQLYAAAVNTGGGNDGTGDGLTGAYFDNKDFTGTTFTRVDPTVDFNWGYGSPDARIGPDTFSVRWTGQVQPRYSEEYSFFTTADDGVRVSVNGQQIINDFVDQAPTTTVGKITLQAGQKYDITMEYFETGQLALAQLGWFSANQGRQVIPKSQLYSTGVLSAGTIEIDPASNAITVNESGTKATITVLRKNGTNSTATVDYTTNDGPAGPNGAVAGSDYTATTGTLTFLPGESSKTVDIPILNDTVSEQTETFNFAIGRTTGAGLGILRTSTITILDDDAAATYAFAQPNFGVSEAVGSATVTVQRGGDTTQAGTVQYATGDGPVGPNGAVAGADYTATTGTLAFAAGETSKTFAVAIADDALGERDEALKLTLSAPTGGALGGQSTAVITINDNDPGTFDRQTLVTGLTTPITIDWTPNGKYIFIAQQDGFVLVQDATSGQLLGKPFIDISGQVNGIRDRGLLGMTLDPNFYNGRPYVYLLFTYDPPEAGDTTRPGYNPELGGKDKPGNRPSRLIRVTADATKNYLEAVAGSEVILLGKNSNFANTRGFDENSTTNISIAPSGYVRDANGNNTSVSITDYLTSDSESHGIGSVKFGPDGKLYVSIGDGASYNFVDPRALRVLDLDNLSGKILRIDPDTGAGLADNPFYNGNAASNRGKVYDYGVRNPFRINFSPTGDLVLGDVGYETWEEINIGGGKNFGWPAFEGGVDANGNPTNLRTGGYEGLQSVKDYYATNPTVSAPLYSFKHTPGGDAVILGDYSTKKVFPQIYDNSLFFANSSKGTVSTVFFDAAGKANGTRQFASGLFGAVQVVFGPDGNLYYVQLGEPAGGAKGQGSIGRWVPTGTTPTNQLTRLAAPTVDTSKGTLFGNS